MAEVRDLELESLAGYEKFAGEFVDRAVEQGWVREWANRQVYIALGQLMLSAAMLGVDACPMEGIDPEAFDKLLGLEETSYRTVVACPLGYCSISDKYATTPKVRFEKAEVMERR